MTPSADILALLFLAGGVGGFIDSIAGGGGLILADWMSFEAMYRLMAVFMAACVAVTLLAPGKGITL